MCDIAAGTQLSQLSHFACAQERSCTCSKATYGVFKVLNGQSIFVACHLWSLLQMSYHALYASYMIHACGLGVLHLRIYIERQGMAFHIMHCACQEAALSCLSSDEISCHIVLTAVSNYQLANSTHSHKLPQILHPSSASQADLRHDLSKPLPGRATHGQAVPQSPFRIDAH